jgi:predicted translin family RNA/ssDNA-binding protein
MPDPTTDAWNYAYSYSGGMEEFIEALSFYWYLKNDSLITPDEVNAFVTDNDGELRRPFSVSTKDYIMGVLDLPGEVMRFATNSLASGDVTAVERANVFLGEFSGRIQLLGFKNKQMPQKTRVMNQSWEKVRLLSYRIKVRSAEFSEEEWKSMLAREAKKPLLLPKQQEEE